MNATEAIRTIRAGEAAVKAERATRAAKARAAAVKGLPKLWSAFTKGKAGADDLRELGELLVDLPDEKQAEIVDDFDTLKRADRFKDRIADVARLKASIAKLHAGPAAANIKAGIDCAETREFRRLTMQHHAIQSGTPERELAELRKTEPVLGGTRPETEPKPKAPATRFTHRDDDEALARQKIEDAIATQRAIVERTTPRLAEVTSKWKAETDAQKKLLLGRERGTLVVDRNVATHRLDELKLDLAACAAPRGPYIGVPVAVG